MVESIGVNVILPRITFVLEAVVVVIEGADDASRIEGDCETVVVSSTDGAVLGTTEVIMAGSFAGITVL